MKETIVIRFINGDSISLSNILVNEAYNTLYLALAARNRALELPTGPHKDKIVINLDNVTHFFISAKGDTDA